MLGDGYGFGSLSRGIPSAMVDGYEEISTRGWIPIPKWLMHTFSGQGPVPGQGSDPVDAFMNEPYYV